MGRTPTGETREKVYRFVRSQLLAGRPPSIREVQEAFGFRAVETARAHLRRLVEAGRLVQLPGRARGYVLPVPAVSAAAIPLLGRVQAGSLTTAVEDPDGYITVEHDSADAPRFALRIRGESMRDAGILPHDVVIVRQQDTARSGDIVVALIDDEATVKTLRIRNQRVFLEPQNPDFETLEVPPDELRVLGRVVEVRRYLDGDRPRIE